MSKRDDELLADYWRTTARAPRAYPGAKLYDIGLDVLGAAAVRKPIAQPSKFATAAKSAAASIMRTSPLAAASTVAKTLSTPKPQVPKPVAAPSRAGAQAAANAKTRAQAAASHANATASKLSRLHPQMSSKLRKLSSAATTSSSKLTARVTAAAARAKATKVKGYGETTSLGPDPAPPPDDTGAAAAATSQVADAVDYGAQAGDVAVQILLAMDQLKKAGNTPLAQEGQAIVDRCNAVVDEQLQELATMTGAGVM